MPMTFNKYMDNPSQGTSTFTNRGMYQQMYRKRFDTLMVREQGRIAYKIYKTNNATDSFYIHLKIPSEELLNFYYDVVVELYTRENVQKTATNLRAYNVRFFSNDHAFIFSFAHAFNKHGLFIPVLQNKMLKQSLKEKAMTRNPRDDIWYVKSLCFAFYAMERYSLFTRSALNQKAVKYNQTEFLKNITSAQDKLDQHNKVKSDQKAKKKLESESKRRQDQAVMVKNKFITNANKIGRTPKIGGSIKRTKTIRVIR